MRRCRIPLKDETCGLLGELTVRKAGLRWYYIIEGRVPLALAEKMYEDPVGRHDIRVAGHCGCPPPAEWATWYAPSGRKIVGLDQQDECRRFLASSSQYMKELAQRLLNDLDFAEDPSAVPGAEGFVESYHIDSEVGLRVFADYHRAFYDR
jgi:hypothetical protein